MWEFCLNTEPDIILLNFNSPSIYEKSILKILTSSLGILS